MSSVKRLGEEEKEKKTKDSSIKLYGADYIADVLVLGVSVTGQRRREGPKNHERHRKGPLPER